VRRARPGRACPATTAPTVPCLLLPPHRLPPTDTLKVVQPPTPAFPMFTNPPTPPTTPPREVPLFEQPSTHDSNATSPPSCSPLHSRLLAAATWRIVMGLPLFRLDGADGRRSVSFYSTYSPPLPHYPAHDVRDIRKLASAKIALACAPCTAQEPLLAWLATLSFACGRAYACATQHPAIHSSTRVATALLAGSTLHSRRLCLITAT
jgi:hypothetical protein